MATTLNILVVPDSEEDAQGIFETLQKEGLRPLRVRIVSENNPRIAAEEQKVDVSTRGAEVPGRGVDAAPLVASDPASIRTAIVVAEATIATPAVTSQVAAIGTSPLLNEIRCLGTLLRQNFDEHFKHGASPADHAIDHSQAASHPVTSTRNDVFVSGAQSDALFHQLAERIRDVFLAWDVRQKRIVYVSPSYETVWNRPRARLYEDASELVRYIHPDDRLNAGQFFDKVAEGNPASLEFRILLPDESFRWLSARNFPIFDAAGEVCCFASLLADVTCVHLSEQGRAVAEKQQRDNLVREVHHRIKNNLQGVVGLLRQHATRYPELKPPLESAIAQVNAMEVVHGLQSKVSGEALLLCEMVEAICRTAVGLTGVPINPVLDKVIDRPVFLAQEEAVPLALILNELVFNAVKHRGQSAKAGPLSVAVDRTETSASVRILNSGVRLPEDFDFATGRGLGTGLMLVKSLLPRAAAQLSIRTEPEGVVALLELEPPIIKIRKPD